MRNLFANNVRSGKGLSNDQRQQCSLLKIFIIAPTIFVVPMASFLFLTSLMQCKSPQCCYADISLYEILVSCLSLQIIKSYLVL